MITSLNITLQLRLANKPGTLAKVLDAIALEGGSLGAIDLVSATPSFITRDLMVRLKEKGHLNDLIQTLKRIPDVQVTHVADRVITRHMGGKIEVVPKRPVQNWEDLAIVYTPGVAVVSETLAQKPDMAYKLTMKGNTVAIVTDGSAVLGLGNLGPTGALPVMEGKAVLFKQFGGVDAVPICLDVHEPQQIIDTVAALAPAFGGINLEDIAAPKCFEIEEKLKQLLDIPVFHDDQHGTAIVTVAGLINALKVVDKDIHSIKLVMSGAGAAGVAIANILISAGVRNLIVCDRKGAISRHNMPSEPSKQWLAENTNPENIQGSLKEVIAGADAFVGVSAPGVLNRADIQKMSPKPVVFALANPEPEIPPEEIYDIAGVIATGRSDYPNQINNALAFPGIFRGALNCHATTINDEMCLAAAYALAGIIEEDQLTAEHIIPSVFNEKVAPAVSKAVEDVARKTGVSRKGLHNGINGHNF
ncbi:Malate dehydrogenase (oxaloacetate-decarboxylating) [Desulforamulus reducens MI-1]|uniref:Malate dehydrogenase (Oxaloacetate-decarboxylating) n=1 Tax=Desulforamulus reducens (strain ATCC BAA-1160 / DSM 100696 / MI-1) TaxID=349161 RepID=A4J8Q5_DESRM|nr:NAD-dependent malic enzyme [Desulforamulus reducens]ABO51458.1 Malate dehydrogenase (oxaloacetate-decarboxylating) [Desulforamulus reducens MI-1]